MLSGNSLRQTIHTNHASVHQAAKLVAAILRVPSATACLAESNGSLLPGFMTHIRLQADCKELASAQEPCDWQSNMGYLFSNTVTTIIEISHHLSCRSAFVVTLDIVPSSDKSTLPTVRPSKPAPYNTSSTIAPLPSSSH